MTLLTVANRVQRLLSLPTTSTFVADGQETQNLLYEHALQVTEDILARHEWPALKREHSFTASLASLQSSGKPSNFYRAIKGTFWNRSTDRQIGGPITEEEWALAYGEPFTSAIEQYAQFRYDGLHIYPVPTVADTIAYSYIINTPVLATDGSTYKTAFTADSDTFLLSERLLVLGMRWRYLADKGRDYAEALKDYELACAQELARQEGAPRDVWLAIPDDDGLPAGHIPVSGFGA